MVTVPPCLDALLVHIKKTNFQALFQYLSVQAITTISRTGGHGWHIVNGKLEVTWTDGFFMPQELVEIQIKQEDDYEEYPELEDLNDADVSELDIQCHSK